MKEKVRLVAITTEDNPFNPISQFAEWFAYDESCGYHTSSYLARVSATSEELTRIENEQAKETAIDEMIRLNLTGNYKKVVMFAEMDDKTGITYLPSEVE